METASTTKNGSAWAAIAATGVACAALGTITCLAERFASVSKALNFYKPAGDLSGKSSVAIAVWMIACLTLDLRWRQKQIHRVGRIIWATVFLIFGGLLAVFPPVVDFLLHK